MPSRIQTITTGRTSSKQGLGVGSTQVEKNSTIPVAASVESNKSKFGAPGSNNSSLFDASSPKNYDGVTMSNDRLTDYIRATNLKDR